MNRRILAVLSAVLVAISVLGCNRPEEGVSVAIAPYQDIAMIVNIANLGLEQKYGTKVSLVTMPWEEILPAVASAGKTVDVGFGSLTEYLTKFEKLNSTAADPVLFVYPVYVFKGGSFVTFKPEVKPLDRTSVTDKAAISAFLSHKIGAQRNSIYEMMLYSLARRGGVPQTQLQILDTPLNDGFLAAQQGSLDIATAGLTQVTETLKRGGRVVLDMETLGFADLTGFIAKKSVLDAKRTEIEALVKMWFECVSYVFADIDKNSAASLDYLRKTAATAYTIDSYKTALSQEFFPKTLAEAKSTLASEDGQYSYRRISDDIGEYLVAVKVATKKPAAPALVQVSMQ